MIKKIDGITDLNDHSSREGMRICIDLRKECQMQNVVLNQLYKHTQLQDTFGVIMLCVVPQGDSLVPKGTESEKSFWSIIWLIRRTLLPEEPKYDLNKSAGTMPTFWKAC